MLYIMKYFWKYDRSTCYICFLHLPLDNIKAITCIWAGILLENIDLGTRVNCVINNSCTVDPNVSKPKINHIVKYFFNLKIKMSMKIICNVMYIFIQNFWTEINRYRRLAVGPLGYIGNRYLKTNHDFL